MDSIRMLVAEHDNILKMLDVIHQASLRMVAGGPAEVNDFYRMIDFIRNYADKTHHGKEEEFLFLAMAEQLGATGENLVRHGMLVEHDLGRLYVSELDAALAAYAAEPTPEAKLAILVAAGSYERLLRRHIQKENDVIFPFGEKQLPEASRLWVEEQTHRFEEDAHHRAQRAHQLQTLAELMQKYKDNGGQAACRKMEGGLDDEGGH